MPKIVRMPDGRRVRFPDEDTDTDIQQFILQHTKPKSKFFKETTGRQDRIMRGWMDYVDENRPDDDPQKKMLIDALKMYNYDLRRTNAPPPAPRKWHDIG